jgi:hypothetical protein
LISTLSITLKMALLAPDAQCQCQDNDRREHWIACELPDGVADVLQRVCDEACTVRVAAVFLYLLLAAKRKPRLSRGLLLSHAGLLVLFNFVLEMKTEFVVQFRFNSVSAKQCTQTKTQVIQHESALTRSLKSG